MLKTKNKSVLIIGTGSLLNYGCEAIVQGSYQILKTIMPDCNITVASKDIEYDGKFSIEVQKFEGFQAL